jgi:hypothetical protein
METSQYDDRVRRKESLRTVDAVRASGAGLQDSSGLGDDFRVRILIKQADDLTRITLAVQSRFPVKSLLQPPVSAQRIPVCDKRIFSHS